VKDDIHEIITNVDGIHNGVEGLLFKTGRLEKRRYLILPVVVLTQFLQIIHSICRRAHTCSKFDRVKEAVYGILRYENNKAIEKASDLLGSFRPIRKVPICSNCGLKEEKITEKFYNIVRIMFTFTKNHLTFILVYNDPILWK